MSMHRVNILTTKINERRNTNGNIIKVYLRAMVNVSSISNELDS